MKNTIVAGSFQKLHVGHEALLKTAFDNAEFVYIGLMDDAYVKSKKVKTVPYSVRKKNLTDYLNSFPSMRDHYKIESLYDEYGDAIYDTTDHYESITVSTETLNGALEINKMREKMNLPPLTILLVPVVRDECGEKLSSTRILTGVVDRTGEFRNKPTVTILGTTGGLTSEYRACAGIVISKKDKAILLDCGNDTGIQIIKAKINQDDISAIFISHAHIDHYLGLPMLVFHQMMMYGRKRPLHIRAPEKVINLMKEIQSHYFEMPFEIDYGTYCDGYTASIDGFHVTPFEVKHSVEDSHGFIVKDDSGKKIVYSGDTSYCDTIIDACVGADLVIHEATYEYDHDGALHGHSTVKDAIMVYEETRPKLMVLTHISVKYHGDMTGYMKAIDERGFRCLHVASDLEVIKL